MPSEQENQSPNTIPREQSLHSPQANDIGGRLQDGDSILDFVQKNTPGHTPAGEAIQHDMDAMAAEHNDTVITAPEQEPVVVPDVVGEDPPEPTPAAEEPTPEESQEEPESDEDGLDLKGTTAENFKKLRTKLQEVSEESKKKDTLLSEVTQELESFAKGDKIPEELAKREARITELEHYEKLLNLKKSKYYQDNFVKPLNGIGNRLNKIAKDYNIDPDQLRNAANLSSGAELNRFLSNNFDTVGAGEVKGIIQDYQQIRSQAMQAEQEPEEALNGMIDAANAARTEHRVQKLEVMQEVTREAWKGALDFIKEEGKIRELIYKEGDMEHNSKVFTPIVQAAATEYGKVVKQLVANGLEELPAALAGALSRQCLLAHASAVAIESRERAVSMAQEIETNTQRTNKYTRPSVSGGVGSGGSARNGSSGPSSTMDAAQAILDQVKGRSRV